MFPVFSDVQTFIPIENQPSPKTLQKLLTFHCGKAAQILFLFPGASRIIAIP